MWRESNTLDVETYSEGTFKGNGSDNEKNSNREVTGTPCTSSRSVTDVIHKHTFYPQMVPKVKERLLTCNSCLFPVQDRKLAGQGDKRVQKCHVFLVLLYIFGVNLIINCS